VHHLQLLSVFFRTSVQTDMEYRADFFTRIVASLLGLVATVGGLSIAYHYVPAIKGWSFAQVLVLVAVYYLMDGLIEMFIAPNMRNVMAQVRDGTLDFVLLKPVSAQFMASFRTMNVWRIANVFVGAGLTAYTIGRLSLSVGWAEAAAFALTLLAGFAVVYSFWLVLVTLTFWFVKVDNIEQIVWQAFEAGREICRPVRPDTIAKSLAIGNPADGPYALELARRSGGSVDSVTDDDIRAGIGLLARTTGIFTETAGGVTIATLAKLAGRGHIDPRERVVAVITGDGLKTLDAVRGSFEIREIEASVDSFERSLRGAALSAV